MVRFSFSRMTRLFRSGPAITRAIASSRSAMMMTLRLFRAARMAPSLMRLARSAPENPGVCFASAADVGAIEHHVAVEAARSKQSRVENVGAVGGGDDDDVRRGLEAVHLHEQLVEGLLALVMTAAEPGATLADR